jgi:hypothetical protein
MKEKIIKINENGFKNLITEVLKPFFYEPTKRQRYFKELLLTTEDNDSIISYGTDTKQEFLFENLNEGLIMSYDINKSAIYLKKKFPNIIKIRSLRFNPYKRNTTTKKNDFVAIDLGKDFSNYREIIKTVETLLGWFVSEIDIREENKNGYIPKVFYKFNDTFQSKDSLFKDDIEFDKYLSETPIISFSIIIEAKYGKRYKQKSGEIFYHATDKSFLKRILKYGLIPKSRGNFPERIYLGTDIDEIKNMVGQNLQDMIVLEINCDGLKLYHDEREGTAYYTYDNIPPDKIVNILEIY